MERRGAAAGSRVIRLLLHVCVLAGVLGMHALTMNHDVATVQSSMHGEHAGVSGVPVHDPAGPPTYLETAPEPMGSMCVAFLGAVTLIGLALYLIWQRSARPAPWATLVRVVPSAVLGRSPPWLAPSLSKLCVLRT
ncbi:DUF6153 family protein [Kribbella shirazensis]|uniref:Uncharacterized protein n=1 Tax=Kribbella shirazensis TaxID=1105143 RepID=A0A7X5VC85_9ACTN|nr:DUF6153 family protein [Kribbella shirazensis]NIK58555.1 hypothetical protein [Kribbella shirazensis]